VKANMSTKRLFLRSLIPKEDDFGSYLSWMRDTKTNSFIESVHAETTLEDLHSFVEFHNCSQNSLLLGIFLKGGSTHIGNIKLEPIVRGMEATLGILIGEEEWRGKGVGYEVISRVLEFCFVDLELEIVKLGVSKKNLKAVNLYKRLGFIENSHEFNSHGSIKMSISNSSPQLKSLPDFE
jgi:ribosomal-protein-alanine N-acetyltransferase